RFAQLEVDRQAHLLVLLHLELEGLDHLDPGLGGGGDVEGAAPPVGAHHFVRTLLVEEEPELGDFALGKIEVPDADRALRQLEEIDGRRALEGGDHPLAVLRPPFETVPTLRRRLVRTADHMGVDLAEGEEDLGADEAGRRLDRSPGRRGGLDHHPAFVATGREGEEGEQKGERSKLSTHAGLLFLENFYLAGSGDTRALSLSRGARAHWRARGIHRGGGGNFGPGAGV